MKRAHHLAAVLCAAALMLAACGSGDEDASGPDRYASGGTFTMSVPTDPGNLNPLMTVLQRTRSVDQLLYDPLVYMKTDGTVVSGLATKWETTPNSATFTIAEGVTCADGSPLGPADVVATFNFIADPANQSPLLGVMVAPGLRAEADDAARTVTLTSPQPDPFLLNNVSLVFVVCAAGLDDPDALARGEHGSGAYTITESVAGDRYTLTRRDGYTWGPDGATTSQQGVPETLIVRVISNETTAANLLLSGEVNAAQVIVPDLQRLDDQELTKGELRSPLGQLFFNQADGRPTQDEQVRRALTAGLDLTEVGQVLTGGTGLPAEGLVTGGPKPCPGNTVEGSLPAHDPAQARALLDQAGWVEGGDGVRAKGGQRLRLTVVYVSALGEEGAAAMELLAQHWRELGVEAELRALPDTQLNEVLFGSGDWDAGLVQITVQVPSQLVPFLSGATPPQGTNFAHIDNPDYQRLVGEAMGLTGEESCQRWNAAEQALFQRADVVRFVDSTIPLYVNGAEFDTGLLPLVPVTVRMLAR
jgi:peptide/nickel transport system substrate-binding protein